VTIEVELGGVRHSVALRRDGDLWVAGVDGREVAVSVVEAGSRWSMLIGPPEGGHYELPEGGHYEPNVVPAFRRTSYDVAFEPVAAGELIVHVNGATVPVTVLDRRRRRGGRSGASDARPRAIVAPMPGRIVKVLVTPGATVRARQPLVVVEAMKMENELRAPRDGVVEEVRVSDGLLVEANAVLLVLR
jgi:biotin carboxyl carrier protein